MIEFNMRFLVLITGQGCSLKCRDCANFSPYMGKDYFAYKYENLMKDMRCILDHVASLQMLQIQGGAICIS